jgi:hypothetical protein
MKNSYEAPEISIVSRVGSFVLGQKPWGRVEWDAVLGFGYGWDFINDLDEGETD